MTRHIECSAAHLKFICKNSWKLKRNIKKNHPIVLLNLYLISKFEAEICFQLPKC